MLIKACAANSLICTSCQKIIFTNFASFEKNVVSMHVNLRFNLYGKD